MSRSTLFVVRGESGAPFTVGVNFDVIELRPILFSVDEAQEPAYVEEGTYKNFLIHLRRAIDLFLGRAKNPPLQYNNVPKNMV